MSDEAGTDGDLDTGDEFQSIGFLSRVVLSGLRKKASEGARGVASLAGRHARTTTLEGGIAKAGRVASNANKVGGVVKGSVGHSQLSPYRIGFMAITAEVIVIDTNDFLSNVEAAHDAAFPCPSVRGAFGRLVHSVGFDGRL